MWGKGGGIFSFFSFQRIIRKNFKLFFVGEFLRIFHQDAFFFPEETSMSRAGSLPLTKPENRLYEHPLRAVG